MKKHNQIHTLFAPHYKAHFRFLRKWKDFTESAPYGTKTTLIK